MKQEQVYRWSIKTEDVYSFLGFEHAGTIASYKSEVSGFIRKDRVPMLLSGLRNERLKGKYFEGFKMVSSKRYWSNYDSYQAEGEYKMKFLN